MANWCQNELLISGPEDQLDALEDICAGFYPQYGDNKGEFALCLNNIVECPFPEGTYEASEWRMENWGTKRVLHAEQTDDLDYLSFVFHTAWSPAEAFAENASKEWPDLTFDLSYEEPGMVFRGRVVFKAGKKLHEEDTSAEYRKEMEEMYQ